MDYQKGLRNEEEHDYDISSTTDVEEKSTMHISVFQATLKTTPIGIIYGKQLDKEEKEAEELAASEKEVEPVAEVAKDAASREDEDEKEVDVSEKEKEE